MDDVILARALHVIGAVLWIGGVAFVTSIVLPVARGRMPAGDRLQLFDAIERRFAVQARWTTLLTGLSGLYMVHRLDLWDRFLYAEFWWMHAMAALWLLFSLMLFLLEPLFLGDWFRRRALAAPERTFGLALRLHRGLLIASIVTIAGAVAGAHGLSLP
jgi:hypothetical protein